MSLSDAIHCLFSARVERRGGSTVIEVPDSELNVGDVQTGEVYRVAILPRLDTGPDTAERAAGATPSRGRQREARTPPVSEGDVREVEIEGIGDQGDGIAKVDRGFVIIVPDTKPGERVEVEIENVYDNFALARVVDEETAV